MASASESKAAELAELKKEVVEILSACEGHCLDISKFKHEYKVKFSRRNFDKHYKQLLGGKKFKNFLADLDDIIDVHSSEQGHKFGYVMKLKEPASKHFMTIDMPTPVKMPRMASSPENKPPQAGADSKLSPKSPVTPASSGKKSAVAASAGMGSINSMDDSSSISGRTFLKAKRRARKTAEVKEKNDPPHQNVAPSVSLESPASSSSEIVGLSPLHPLLPPPVSRLGASGFGRGAQVARPQLPGDISESADHLKARTVSLLEIMKQQAEEENQASGGLPSPHAGYGLGLHQQMETQQAEEQTCRSLPSPHVGYGRLLQEMDTPRATHRNVSSSPAEINDARIREVGTPGPFERSIEHAYREMESITPRSKAARNISFQEVNRAVEDIITSLAEEGRFVSLQVVKARLCREFGKSDLSAMGFKRDKDIPALNELIQMQNKVSLFVHAYVMTNSIATLYELNQSLADLGSKTDFEDLRLGPLLQQPVVYDMFKAPPGLPSLPHITTIHILKHLEKYMTKNDLWRQKVDLQKFMEYLCEEYQCETPYHLGVRIQSIGLAISVFKKSKHGESEKWKAIREQLSVDLEDEIQRHLRKIKKDLLGQELGDLRSCAMKFLDASPVDALKAVFDCCLEMFDGKPQKKITKFFKIITEKSLGRRLFQLALYVSCKRLLGDALERLVDIEVKAQVAESEVKRKETKTRPVPPSEGVIVQEVKEWLSNAENVDLARLAIIEGNVVNKFPGFRGFEDFGHGSFLKFLTKHKELMEAIEQVGGMTRSGGVGTTLGHQVSLNSVLDFISQCGTQTSPETIERTLCSYYAVSKVTDLGFGSCSNLLKKAAEQKKKQARVNTPSIVYEAALLHHESDTKDSHSLDSHHGGVLGYKSKEEALEAIQSTPLLEDVSLWTHWDDVYGGEVSKLGDLKSFLENEGILMIAGKSSLEGQSPLVVMETSPGVVIRVTTDTSPEMFKECACHGDVIGTAGHLVSMVMVNGGVANTPVALLANHMQSCLASMAVNHDKDEYDRRAVFVLECLVRMPHRLAHAIGSKVFLEPLKKLVGSTEAPSLLLSCCSTQSQRGRLHQLGFALGINQWIEDFQNGVSCRKQEDREFHFGFYTDGGHKRPVAVVRPVKTSNAETLEQVDVSFNEPEDEGTNVPNEDSVDVEEGEEVTSDTEEIQAQSPSTAPSTEQQAECRAVIEQIRREDFGIGLELGEEESKLVQRQREREGRGLHRLSTELYTRDTHFVLELVQNADDNSYPEDCSGAGFPSLMFILERDKIVVLNNEVGFEEKNIRALCDVGRSTKGAHRYGYIGQKGIGFKSVFRVSDCPEVHSNGYHIRFDAKSGPIGYILPQWIGERCADEERSENEDDGLEDKEESDHDEEVDCVRKEFDSWPTRIVLPLKEEHQGIHNKSSLAARFRDVHPSLLLFLHRLRGIFIDDQVNNCRREMVRKDLDDNIMEVSHSKGTDRWLVIKKELDATNMKEDVEMTELALAFPLFDGLGSDKSLGKRHQTLPQQNVFAYLPLRSYGFRFIIQGDFEVPSSREDVDSDKSWNQWLREEIPQLFIDALSVFTEHSSFSGLSSVASYFQFVPLEEEILDFFTPVARHILKLLQGKPCIPVKKTNKESEQLTSNGNNNTLSAYEWVLPCKAVYCEDRTIQELVTSTLLEEHLGLSYLHPEMSPALNPTLRSRLGIETLSSKHLIEIGKAEGKKASADCSAHASPGNDRRPDVARIGWVARWLQCMYRCLELERNSSQEMLDVIGSLSVIPLTDGSFVNLMGDSVFLPLSMNKMDEGDVPKKKKAAKSQEQTCSGVLEKDLSTVHPALFSSLDDIGRSQVEQLLRRLGVKTWSPRELINSHIIPNFKSDKWKAKSKEVLRSYLVYILEERLTDPSVCAMNELRSCVQILTNKGAINPITKPIYFTPKYGNTIDLARQLPSISWTLIDDSYLESCTVTSKVRSTDWKDFLAELGVQSFLAIKRKQVKLHRDEMVHSPWASYEPIWQTTPDGLYIVDDWTCEEFDEFLEKTIAPNANQRRINPEESKILAQCIDERWDTKFARYADGSVHVKDTNGHVLAETRSSFYLNLVSKPWIAATTEANSLFLPRDLFLRSDLVYQLLEDHVKYIAADLKNSAFISTLRIRESINVDGMINEMKQWSAACEKTMDGSRIREFTTSVAHMSRVYSFLLAKMSQNEEDRRKINDAFLKNALIFVPRRHPNSSFSQFQPDRKTPGSFLLKKDVCWRDPTDVSVKLFVEHGKETTRRLLERYYSGPRGHQSLAAFFIDQMKVDETPNVLEYIEMASTVAEVASFPTTSSLNDMLKIFATLGNNCIARGHNDDIRMEQEIDQNKASFLKQSLEREQKCIFPSSGKWVALTDKPLLPDDKLLMKIFQKEKSVHFLDFGEFFQPPKRRSSTRILQRGQEEMKQNVKLFLKTCDIQSLNECIQKEFTPTLVQYQCVPLQKYFHQMIPSVQRFLRSKIPEIYDELNHQGFAQKLQQMQFASVHSLETVYSLSTHPDVHIPIKEKSGVQAVGSTFCLYVVQEYQENSDVINAEMVKLLLGGKKQGSSDLSNFMVAVKNYQGNDLEHFLEEVQGLEPLADGEELWSVPAPEEPEEEEVEEEPAIEAAPRHDELRTQSRSGDEGLHSWPPRSAAQYDKTRQREGESREQSTLKMWPPPAPPESVAKPPPGEENRVYQAQGRPPQHNINNERPTQQVERPREKDKIVSVPHQPAEVFPKQPRAPPAVDAAPEPPVVNTNEKNEPEPPLVEGVVESPPREDEPKEQSASPVKPHTPQTPMPVGPCIVGSPGQMTPSRSYLWFSGVTTEVDFEDLPCNGDLRILDRIPLTDNPNKEDVGRWGEQCVFEFLQHQAKNVPPDVQVEIIWVNERGNTTSPYDIVIQRHFASEGRDGNRTTVTTYIEVKTTSSDQKEVFELSLPEVRFAMEQQNSFHLYRVFNAGKPNSVRIRRLQNLASHLERKTVKLCMVI